MNAISFVILIVQRDDDEAYSHFLNGEGITAAYSIPCRGTAGQKLLNLLGLERTEKTLKFFMTDRKRAARILRQAVSQLGLDMPGRGIALIVPVDAVGGASSLKTLMENQNYIFDEVKDMDEKRTFPCALIVAISERGSSDAVMDAAWAAGAGGGTVVHARGNVSENGQSFFGVPLAPEKTMTLIVVNQRDKAQVMHAIMEKAGIHTPAHTVLFSLPVETVAGLKSVMEDSEESE